jgi:hypothetical protein
LSYRPDLGRAATGKAQKARGGNYEVAASVPSPCWRPCNSFVQFLAKIRVRAMTIIPDLTEASEHVILPLSNEVDFYAPLAPTEARPSNDRSAI